MSKRERDGAQGYSVPAATGQQQADMSSEILPALAEEMRAANASLDPEIAAKKAKFIQSKLKSLSADMETRFEFYVRSHFSQRSIKKILQREIECAYDDNNTFISSRDSSSSSSSAAPGSSYYGVGARGGKTDRYTGVPIITEEMAVVVNGLAKLFVGELVDTAISIMKERIHFVAATATTTGEGEDEKKRENLVHQLTEADIEEAANRMHDGGKLGRAATTAPFFGKGSAFSSLSSVSDIVGGAYSHIDEGIDEGDHEGDEEDNDKGKKNKDKTAEVGKSEGKGENDDDLCPSRVEDDTFNKTDEQELVEYVQKNYDDVVVLHDLLDSDGVRK